MKIPYANLPAQVGALQSELIAAISRVFEHGKFMLGPEVRMFEERMAEYLGVQHVIGVNSGTDALILGLRFLGVGAGDEVITVSHSFVATAHAITLTGAAPVFVDIDEETMVMAPGRLEDALTERTKAVLPVHLNGYPCDMAAITSFCSQHDLAVVEDCAQAIGARFDGKSVGSFGIGCFSMHPLKALPACGDGGFIALNGSEDPERLRAMRNFGLVDREHSNEVSGNSRLDTIQAAMLLVKLDHLEDWLEARHGHARDYREALADKVRCPPAGNDKCSPSDGVFTIRHAQRERLFKHLREHGIEALIYYPLGIHQQPVYRNMPCGPLPVTEAVVQEILSLPVSPDLTDHERQEIIDTLEACLAEVDHD